MLDCLISCQHGAESIAHCRHCCTLMMPARTLTPSSLILHPERFSSAMVWLVRKPSLSTCSVSSVQPALLWQLTSIVYGREAGRSNRVLACLTLCPGKHNTALRTSCTVHHSHHTTVVSKSDCQHHRIQLVHSRLGGSTVEHSTPDRKVADATRCSIIESNTMINGLVMTTPMQHMVKTLLTICICGQL
jgi:hypothetical protein